MYTVTGLPSWVFLGWGLNQVSKASRCEKDLPSITVVCFKKESIRTACSDIDIEEDWGESMESLLTKTIEDDELRDFELPN